MPPEVLVLFFGGLFGIGGIILVGQLIERMRPKGLPPQEIERLTTHIDSLQNEVSQLRDELAGLNERVEFTERLLERPKSPKAHPND